MPPAQQIGLHVSAAGGVENAPIRAKQEFNAECFQFFSRSPRGGGAPIISASQAAAFRATCRAHNLDSYIHTPYYINFASKNNKIYHGSINVVREELERGSLLGVKYVVTHLGSARDWDFSPPVPLRGISRSETRGGARGGGSQTLSNQVLKHAIAGLKEIYSPQPSRGQKQFTSELLLEISAGAGAVLGDSFEELAALLKGLKRPDVHICLDTCHLFASGYDIRNKQGWAETLQQFQQHLPLSQIKLVHVNDSKGTLGDHKDRHEHLGHGHLGAESFIAMLAHPALKKVNFILETKHDKLIHDDLAFLQKHRS
jgi:deoxyribonuclease-4